MQFLAGDVKTKAKASRQTKNPKKHHLALCVYQLPGGGGGEGGKLGFEVTVYVCRIISKNPILILHKQAIKWEILKCKDDLHYTPLRFSLSYAP